LSSSTSSTGACKPTHCRVDTHGGRLRQIGPSLWTCHQGGHRPVPRRGPRDQSPRHPRTPALITDAPSRRPRRLTLQRSAMVLADEPFLNTQSKRPVPRTNKHSRRVTHTFAGSPKKAQAQVEGPEGEPGDGSSLAGQAGQLLAIAFWPTSPEHRPQDHPPRHPAEPGGCAHHHGEADRLEKPLVTSVPAYPLRPLHLSEY